MANLFDKRFIINTGKGGVGKTTVSAAMAVAFAQQGKRVLLMQLNARDKIGQLFGKPEIGTDIVQVAPHISCVNTTPAEALREYALMILKVKLVYKAVFENRFVAKFLRALPGLPELTMLGKAYYHEQERTSAGRPRWDVVIIDAPATGHGLFLLQIPQVISGAVGSGLMTRESEKMVELLRDRRRTMVNLITLTEEMPVNETIEYRRQLADELDVSVGYVVANGVFPRTFTPEDADRIEKLLDSHANTGSDVGKMLAAGMFRHQRCNLQAGYLGRLENELEMPLIEVPYYFEPDFDRSVLDRIAAHITESVNRSGGRRR